MDDKLLPNPASLRQIMDLTQALIRMGMVRAAATPGYGCLAGALFQMCMGNRLGLKMACGLDWTSLFCPAYGSFILELDGNMNIGTPLGTVTEEFSFDGADLVPIQEAWESKLEPVFPCRIPSGTETAETLSSNLPRVAVASGKFGKPRALIPVFPGTNCEYDTARALRRAGAEPEILIVNNLSAAAVSESCAALAEGIRRSQMSSFRAAFPAATSPDGSAKFITAFFRADAVTEAVRGLLQRRSGLMLGICNGFQALVKLGLIPFGDIRDMDEACPTLTYNTIGRHQSMLVHTRVSSVLPRGSPAAGSGMSIPLRSATARGAFSRRRPFFRSWQNTGRSPRSMWTSPGGRPWTCATTPTGARLPSRR
jgi:phosphoribosylformylglycinamidine synthase